MDEQELAEKFKVYEREIMQIQDQMNAIEKAIVDLQKLGIGLDELVGKTGEEVLAPVGKGIYLKSKILSEELTVDIGSGNFVKKTIPETKKMIEEQVKKLGAMNFELEEELKKIDKEITTTMTEQQKEHSHEEHKHKNCECEDGEECNCDEDCECEH